MPREKKDVTEEQIEWCIDNAAAGYPTVGVKRIKNHFDVGSGYATRIRDEAREIVSGLEEAEGNNTPYRSCTVKKGEDSGLVVTRAEDITTVEDALEYAQVDTSIWGVARSKLNKWDMGYTDQAKNAHAKALWQVTVWIERKQPIDLAVQNLIERIPDYERPQCTTAREDGEKLLLISFYDHHFSLQAWKEETGENYDLQIARLVWNDATAQTVSRYSGRDIGKILMPIGNDLFHINDQSKQTPRSGNRLDVDTRLAQVIEECEMAVIDAVEEFKQIAPVELFWIPGNHDPQTSYFLMRIMASHYRNDARVTIDTSPKPRKYRKWGRNLLGFAHGCDIAKSKRKQLPGLMADEAADLWEPGQHRVFNQGHKHTRGELSFNSVDSYGSVISRILPSLCGTDYWHFQKGFVGSTKTTQLFLYDKKYGEEESATINVDHKHYE